ncbi:hypothetical protein D3C71_1636920 [compost metagenome]
MRKEVVAIVAEIETPEHFTEIANLVKQGYTVFQHIGAAMAVLSKDNSIVWDYKDEKEITRSCRFLDQGKSFEMTTESGQELLVYNGRLGENAFSL